MSETALPPIRVHGKFLHDSAGKWFLQGVTYGPFPPQPDGSTFPTAATAKADFGRMREMGINTVRVYHPPPIWLLDEAAAAGLHIMAAVPWPQHTETLRSPLERRKVARELRAAVAERAAHPAMMGWMVGNEIAANVVRWVGEARVRAFIEELIDTVHVAHPGAIASYASFPSTEYLLPRNADVLTFNVFLEHRADYARYLARLHNLADGRPLLIGEFGLDTLRHGEDAQASTLAWQHEETIRSGAAGCILFTWSDDWHNGGQTVDDWKFGLFTADRTPRKCVAALRPLLTAKAEPAAHVPLPRTPKVSVIVCAYNAATTLRGCLRAIDRLRYPDFEIILIDDGSNDQTREVVSAWIQERAMASADTRPVQHIVHRANLGLSAARNTGAKAADGEILAFTDADCEPDVDWLYHLVAVLLAGNVAGVGGPNLPPPANQGTQAAVAASPGGPTHVLLTDSVAEHIPGCNMAFWKSALENIGGFDIAFRRAGDDVDFCWRIQSAGGVIAFAPGAVVWHHRRFTMAAYLKQQEGYGEAESLLRFKHPVFFTRIGSAKWRGVIYGAPRPSWIFSHPLVYHGSLGQALFQSIYPAPVSAVAAYLGSLEWLGFTTVAAVLSVPFSWLRAVPVLMFLAMLAVALSWMAAANVERRFDTVRVRLTVAWLSFLQPLVRGWARWRARLFQPVTKPAVEQSVSAHVGPMRFWSETGVGRDALLSGLFARLEAESWHYVRDAGWDRWDVLVFVNHWWNVAISTVTDDHGRGKCLTRVRLHSRGSWVTHACIFLQLFAVLVLFIWQVSLGVIAAGVAAVLISALLISLGSARRRVAALVTRAAQAVPLLPAK